MHSCCLCHIVVSANVDAISSVHAQHNLRRFEAQAHTARRLVFAPRSYPAVPSRLRQILRPVSSMPISHLIPAYGPVTSRSSLHPRPVSLSSPVCFVVVIFRPYIRSRFLIQLSYTHAIPQCLLWCTLPPVLYHSPQSHSPGKPLSQNTFIRRP
ncbi:hypothetical protein BD309DRAFT_966609 [Dichomitus squalens]|nr:hypothetical protein BD309DRAFT_966609 [Dichomitus squalens]